MMINVLRIEVSVFGRKENLALDTRLALEVDYWDYERDNSVLKSAEKTLKKYLKTMHDLHENGEYREFCVYLFADCEDDMEVSFVFSQDMYAVKTKCVGYRWTCIQDMNFESDRIVKKRDEIVKVVMNRIAEHIENNERETW